MDSLTIAKRIIDIVEGKDLPKYNFTVSATNGCVDFHLHTQNSSKSIFFFGFTPDEEKEEQLKTLKKWANRKKPTFKNFISC